VEPKTPNTDTKNEDTHPASPLRRLNLKRVAGARKRQQREPEQLACLCQKRILSRVKAGLAEVAQWRNPRSPSAQGKDSFEHVVDIVYIVC